MSVKEEEVSLREAEEDVLEKQSNQDYADDQFENESAEPVRAHILEIDSVLGPRGSEGMDMTEFTEQAPESKRSLQKVQVESVERDNYELPADDETI